EGTWTLEQSCVVISDSGSKYIVKIEEKTETSTLPCILTKLDSYYFISVKPKGEADEESDWCIYRIQFKDDKLLVLGLNEEGEKLSETIPERVRKSQHELQQWCVRNANLFTDVEYCLERGNANRNTSGAQTASIAHFVEELSAVMTNVDEGFSENNLSSDAVKAYGKEVKKASYKMFSIISKAKFPADIREAALDLAQSYDKIADLLIDVPYIPQDFGEFFFTVLLLGTSENDYVDGVEVIGEEISKWEKRVKQTINDIDGKKRKFASVLINNGVEVNFGASTF
ncbi:MAG: hypothetical protein II943_11515, partial [Victivallales bacterium]|nr:hypothetical protein [Victivallales bacterium]